MKYFTILKALKKRNTNSFQLKIFNFEKKMNLNANFSYNGFMSLLHENLSSCLAFCMCKVMSIKLLEMRKAPVESETF